MDYEAGSRENWHIGSAVEVFSSSDRRWHIGWVVEEDPGGTLRILLDDQSMELIRRDDVKLAPVGKSINRLPPQTEVLASGRAPSVILHQPSGRRCSSLEEAWSAHFDIFQRCHVQLPHPRVGSMTARGDPDSNGIQAAGAQSGSPLPEERMRYDGISIPVLHESELERLRAENSRLTAENSRLTALLEERDRKIRSLIADAKEAAREERDQVRPELERYCGGASPALSRSLPSVPRSWQPHRHDPGAEARPDAPGQSGSAQLSSSRLGERPVEICCTVPRALTPDEVLEEASREERRTVPPVRSVRSLAQAVVRMPSAPYPLTSHGGGQTVSVAASSHSVCMIPASSQAPQPVPTMHKAAPTASTATRLLTAQSARAPSTVSPAVKAGVHKVVLASKNWPSARHP